MQRGFLIQKVGKKQQQKDQKAKEAQQQEQPEGSSSRSSPGMISEKQHRALVNWTKVIASRLEADNYQRAADATGRSVILSFEELLKRAKEREAMLSQALLAALRTIQNHSAQSSSQPPNSQSSNQPANQPPVAAQSVMVPVPAG